MAVSIGPKIGIDGEKQYRDELNKIIQQAKTLDAEMKAVTSSFDENTSAEKKQTEQSKILNQQLETQKQRVEALQKMVEQSANATGENSTATLKWKEALANAQTDLNKTEQAAAHLGDKVDDAGKSMDDGKQKALSFGDILKANLAAEAIKAGVTALANAVKELASALASCVTDSAAFGDEVQTIATKTGLSTDAVQEFKYMAELTDTSLETITGSMAKLTKNMSSAQDGTGSAAEAFASLGVSVTDADGNLRSNQDVFRETLDALGQMSNATERDATAMAIFGKSAQELNPLIATGSAGIAAFAQEAHDMGYVLDGDALQSLVAVDDAMKRLQNTGTALKNNIGLALAPTVESFATELTGFMGQIDFSNGLDGMITSLLAALPDALSSIIENVSTIVETIAPVIPQVIDGLITAFTENAPMLITAAIQLAIALGTGLVQAIPQLLASLPAVLNAILDGFGTGLAPMFEKGKQAISDMWDGIAGSAAMIWDNIKTFVSDNVIGPVKEKITEMASIGTNLVHGLWDGIISSLAWIKGKITEWVGNVLDFIKNLFGIASPSKVTAGYGKFLVMGLAEGIDDNIGLATRAWDNVADAVGFNMGAGEMVTYQGATVNIYPQNMDNATVDYLFEKFNLRMGALA